MLDSTDNDSVSMSNDLNSDETGNSTPQTPMMMASFRIERETWAKFGAIAKRERLTATDVLTQYIQRCTDNDRTEYDVRTDNDAFLSTDTYDTDKFNEAVRMAVSTLSLPSLDDVMTHIDDSIDNRVLPLIESVTGRVIAVESQKTSTDPTVLEEIVKADLLAALKTYTQSQFASVRDELRAINDRLVTINAGKPITFIQLSNQLGYEIPDGVNPSKPRKEGADDLIAFAATLCQSYKWDGKAQRFFEIDLETVVYGQQSIYQC